MASLHDQIWRYMKRLHVAYPLPVTREQAYFGCMPLAILDLHSKGVFRPGQEKKPGRGSNLLHTMFAGFADQSTAQNPLSAGVALHVCSDTAANYTTGINGTEGFERVFWFMAPEYLPMPRNSAQSPFFLPHDHPNRKELIEWQDTVTKVEEDISTLLVIIDAIQKRGAVTSDIHHVWPELLSFARFQTRVSSMTPAARSELIAMIDPVKQRLVELLTTAVMLPENPPPRTAWVGFYTGGD